jgi:hypothetical protein
VKTERVTSQNGVSRRDTKIPARGFEPSTPLPIRPRKRADDAAAGAHHARPEGGNVTSSPKRSTLITASWRQRSQTTHNERTPCARMLARGHRRASVTSAWHGFNPAGEQSKAASAFFLAALISARIRMSVSSSISLRSFAFCHGTDVRFPAYPL